MKVIAKAPTRISLIGGGTDLPVFYKRHKGAVISMAINLRQNITIEDQQPSNNWKIPKNANQKFYESFYKNMLFTDYTNMVCTPDIPIQSGMGSSASAAIALIAGIKRLKGSRINRKEIIEEAWDIEVKKLGLFGGIQDQVASAYGGFNFIEFSANNIKVNSFEKEIAEWWSERIFLYFTGETRNNPKIQEELKELDPSQTQKLTDLTEATYVCKKLIEEQNIKTFGKIMNNMWQLKKEVNPLVTTPWVDKVYNHGIKSGATAGKLLGSGGGGFMAFLVPTENQEKFITNMDQLKNVKNYDFSIDWNGVETRIL